jgi:hypothetical protein
VPRISLNDFADFAVAAGGPKLAKVRQLKRRGAYRPAGDFWRPLGKKIVDSFERGGALSDLKGFAEAQKDPKKAAAYPIAVDGTQKALGTSLQGWFDPPCGEWAHGDLRVRINPELGVYDEDGVPQVLKLYFKKDPLSRARAEIMLHLMSKALPEGSEAVNGIIDLQRGEVVTSSKKTDALDALIDGEAAALLAMWDRV